MDPSLVTAVTPFRFLKLPQEVRDDIYEAAIFDLRPLDMFMTPGDPDSIKLRKLNTNVLLTSRQVYWEARDVIIRRGQLIMVSLPRERFELFEEYIMALSGITRIDPRYGNLCIMSHHIGVSNSHRLDQPHEAEENCGFILHRQDTHFFCRAMMGEFNIALGVEWGFGGTHTLNLHYSSTYGQHESSSIYATQTLILEKYQSILREFKGFKIYGSSIGWESGLYGAVLQDIRRTDDREPAELIDELHTLEQEGSRILLQTGDVESADESWAKALGICSIADFTFYLSRCGYAREAFPTVLESHTQRWVQLRRQNGSECAVPFMDLWYKLLTHRLSAALRFIEQSHHGVSRSGRVRRPRKDYLAFAFRCFRGVQDSEFDFDVDWSPQPSDEAQMCLAMAAILRLLDATDEASEAYRAVRRASELMPDDESTRQERDRVEAWITKLVDNGTLESFPES